jgi:hypothetical protein
MHCIIVIVIIIIIVIVIVNIIMPVAPSSRASLNALRISSGGAGGCHLCVMSTTPCGIHCVCCCRLPGPSTAPSQQQQQQQQQRGLEPVHAPQPAAVDAAAPPAPTAAAAAATAALPPMVPVLLPLAVSAPGGAAGVAAAVIDSPVAAAAAGLGLPALPSPTLPLDLDLEGLFDLDPDLQELLQQEQPAAPLHWQQDNIHLTSSTDAAVAAAAAAAANPAAASAGNPGLSRAGPFAASGLHIDDGVDDDDSSSEMSLALSEECRQRDADVAASLRTLQDVNDQATALSHQVLALSAGRYGADSAAAADSILQNVRTHNWLACRTHNARRVQLQELTEGWFLGRSPMHLVVSIVTVWGPDGSQQPKGVMPGEQRLYLLQQLLAFATAGSNAAGNAAAQGSGSSSSRAAVSQLLQLTNRNKASVFFSACHFSIPEVLCFLLGLPELGWRQMLQATKRGALLLWQMCCCGRVCCNRCFVCCMCLHRRYDGHLLCGQASCRRPVTGDGVQ